MILCVRVRDIRLGVSKEEMQEAIAPLLDQLKELKDKAKARIYIYIYIYIHTYI